MRDHKIIAYRLDPIYEDDTSGALRTAALMTCLATGRVLDGMGGGGEFLDPAIVDALRDEGVKKVIITEEEYDHLLERDAWLRGLED